jgi:hypothetical protein
MMLRFPNATDPQRRQLVTRYLAVKVLLPGVKPVIRYVALAWMAPMLLLLREWASLATCPAATKLMYAYWVADVPPICAVRITSALPESGMVAVTLGPEVERSV